jgi:hypothetical protein
MPGAQDAAVSTDARDTPPAPARPRRAGIGSIVAPVLTTWSVLSLYLVSALVIRPSNDMPGCAVDGVDRLAHWDGGWYTIIAEHGYVRVPGPQQPSAFFPLLPWLSRAAHTALPFLSIEACGIVINLIAITAAMVIVDRLLTTWQRWQRVGCIVLLLSLPGAYFYTLFYSEALFVLAVVVVAWALQRPDRLWIAATGVVVASLDRSIGIILVVPVAIAAGRTRDRREAISIVATSCAGVAAFGVWVVLAGKVDLFRESRAGWRGAGGLSYPVYIATHAVGKSWDLVRNAALWRRVTPEPVIGKSLSWGLGLLMDVVVVAALVALRRVRAHERFLVVLAIVLGGATLLAGPAISQLRFTVVLVPLWIAVIGVLRNHRSAYVGLVMVAIAGLAVNVYLVGEFSACRWAG